MGGAQWSPTVGIPSFLSPPEALGIDTCFTAGGKYVPELIRFHILNRLFFRSNSKGAASTFNQGMLTKKAEGFTDAADTFTSILTECNFHRVTRIGCSR
jgi:hypothetical protein